VAQQLTCGNATAIGLTPRRKSTTQHICVAPLPQDLGNFPCSGPAGCAELVFFNVSLDFADQWGPFDAVWVGAKACGCNTTVSLFQQCDSWRSTGMKCGGTVVYRTNSGSAAMLLAIGNQGGSCCSPGGLDCCFDITIAAAPWLPPSQPPHACCPQ
jgi:hypothetical protein